MERKIDIGLRDSGKGLLVLSDHLGRWSGLGTIKCIRFHQRFNQTEVD